VTPDNLQRWRLNGYFNWRPNKKNQVEITMSYTPEQFRAGVDSSNWYNASQVINHASQHFVNPRLVWHSELLHGLRNDLQGAYVHSIYRENDRDSSIGTPAGNDANEIQENYDEQKSYHLWIRDHLGYKITIGGWDIEPLIDASFEHINERSSVEGHEIFYGNPQYPYPSQSGSETIWGASGNVYRVTPSLDIRFKKAIDVEGGVLMDVGHDKGNGGRRHFPFAALSIDLLRLASEKSSSSLKFFGSYAKRNQLTLQGYSLADLSHGINYAAAPLPSNPMVVYGIPYGTTYGNSNSFFTVLPTPDYWVWEAGVALSAWKDRLHIQYNFERRNYLTDGTAFGYLISYITQAEWKSSQQHADLRINAVTGVKMCWQTGLNLTLLRSNYDSAVSHYVLTKPTFGDRYPHPYSWTGGWVNRIQIRNFTAGLDLLYHFGETYGLSVSYGTPADSGQRNSIVTPNVFAGYCWHLAHSRTLEFFLESRGLIRNTHSDLLDERRYYTVGGKLAL
jgi:hypothetical protein